MECPYRVKKVDMIGLPIDMVHISNGLHVKQEVKNPSPTMGSHSLYLHVARNKVVLWCHNPKFVHDLISGVSF